MVLCELVELPGGSFRMGSVSFYPEEAPIHTATVAPFAIERHPVTNAAFAEFVADTGYVTVAERPLDPALYPGVAEADLLPGALVVRPTPGPVDLRAWRQGWDGAPGAHWRQPVGAGSDTTYAWGQEPSVDGALMANTWQGRFPYRNDGALGFTGTSPVGTFPANGFGLVDMIGNVWEWTTTRFSAHHLGEQQKSACCPPPADPDPSVNQTLKGGSHLCAPEYCHRYRPAARSPQSQDSSTTHIGFRCVVSR